MADAPAPAWLAGFPGVRAGEPLAKHSQYGIGGPADWFVQSDSRDAVVELRRRCTERGVPLTVIGAGSNTLIRDGGVRGVVLEITDKHLAVSDGLAELGAGCMMPRAALDLAKQGQAGLEFGIGIPGTCGASVRGNAGAFGREIKDALVDCEVVDARGEVRRMAAAECGFGYRTSVFKREEPETIVLAGRFAVHADEASAVRQRTDEIQAQRKATQPYGIRSLGSVFANPPGDHAGRLVEACGLKGRVHGGAAISDKHANFIVNVDHASAEDVLALVRLAETTVAERFGVELEREIVVIGEAAEESQG